MSLNKLLIGTRIRKIREEIFKESRELFSNRCNLSERHVGQIERGESLINLETLDKIYSSTSIPLEYIIYGIEDNSCELKSILNNILDNSSNEDLQMYYECICAINKNRITKKG